LYHVPQLTDFAATAVCEAALAHVIVTEGLVVVDDVHVVTYRGRPGT